jgi:hypothetical protein
MQLPERSPRVLSSSGVIATSGFQIDASPLAFRILSSGIYSDKIGAVLREVGCNATDAHIEMGTPDRPIEVKLPNSLDPLFWVKDWGPGLPDELVRGTPENNYTDGVCVTYFASLKRQCSKQTGHHGLGFKAPYSYTDSFTVVSCHEGVRRTYCAYLNEEELPTMALLGEEPVSEDWPHGIMVSLSVAPRDIVEFGRKAQEIFRYFEVTPTVLGGEPIRAQGRTLQGSNFFFEKTDRKARLIMASVAYPLHVERLPGISELEQALVRAGLCLRLENGSVRPTASREEIEYDDLARKTVPAALKSVPEEVARRVYEMLSVKAPTDWEQHAAAKQTMSDLPGGVQSNLKELLGLLGLSDEEMNRMSSLCWTAGVTVPAWVGAPQYLPKEVDTAASFPFNLDPEFIGPPEPRYFPRVLDPCQQFEVWHYTESPGGRLIRRRVELGRTGKGGSSDTVDLKYGDKVEVVVVDEPAPHWNGRVRERFDWGKFDDILLVRPLTPRSVANARGYSQRLSEALGSIQITSAADLALPEKVVRRKELSLIAKVEGRKPSIRRLHSDIEVTLVTFKGPSAPVKFGSIPDDCVHYLEYTDRRRQRRVYKGEFEGKQYSLNKHQLEEVFVAYRNLAGAGMPLPELPSYIEVKPATAKQLKLEVNGFATIFKHLETALKSVEMRRALRTRISTVPKLELVQEYHARQMGLIPYLAHFQLYRKNSWQYVAPFLQKHPVLANLVDRVALTHQNQLPEARIRSWIDKMGEHLDVKELLTPQKGGAQVFGTATDLKEAVNAAYPLARFIHLSEVGNGLTVYEKPDIEKIGRTLAYLDQLLVKAPEYQQKVDALCPVVPESDELAKAG